MTVLLHGFWGQPQDWNEVVRRLPLNVDVQVPDLYQDDVLGPAIDMKTWVKHFLSWLESHSAGQKADVVAYSMGARLAAQAVMSRPESFGRVLLLSGNPALHPNEFKDREAWENAWAEKFQSQPWAELEKGWQEQPVFAGTPARPRRRDETLREKLAQSLVNWSPRHHFRNLEDLKALSPMVEWAFGALDQKYLKVAKTLQELPVRGQITIIPNAGHRLNIDAADFVVRWIESRGKQ